MIFKAHSDVLRITILTACALSCSSAFARPEATDSAVREADSQSHIEADSTPARSPETDERLKRADAHLDNGRQFYFQGNLAGAHREFDAAVDTLLAAPDSLPDHRRIERRLDEICDLIYRFDVEKLGAGRTDEGEVAFDKAPIDEISHMTFPVDQSIASKLKGELNQTASGIPLELSDPVLSYVHFYSSDRGRAILLAGLRRSGRYRPMIQRILAEEGVPEELIYLAQAESGFLPRALSNKHAVGMWQFIAETGSTYDLVHTAAFDERLDPEKATRGAARFLKHLYERYGDWYLAMAAYNCGAGAVDRAVERTGYADYWELLKRHALPRETAGYVPIILAMTIMAKNPQDYGLESIDLDVPVEYDSLQLSASTNLNLIADATMQPLSVIRDLNPSLLKMVAPAGFQIHVPKGSADTAQAALESVPAVNRTAWRLHHVESGDTLEAIARTYHSSTDRITAANQALSSLNAGNTLLIPVVYHEEVQPSRSKFRSARSRHAKMSITSGKASVARRGTHIAASRRVSAPPITPRRSGLRSTAFVR
ncbi:MAG: transglycosylase SLT domain-containing protein [Acidobacteriaceae bacterium]|nr:transglycosylase SLT domain-containing protein [Acidobacteriaceae bacterium]MBV9305884.1 transglycosylase SLT domain-containing protein [Acidobacteriaceae bacterium]MBV9676314.1 transglycosylase SLT domain-containing protein [Acidobacteriaceae bacterium]